MDVLGVLFCILLVGAAVIGIVAFIGSTLDRVKDLEKDKAARAAVDLKASRREKITEIMTGHYSDTFKIDTILSMFEN